MKKKRTIEDAIDRLRDADSAADDARDHMAAVERMLENLDEVDREHVTEAVIDAVKLGLPMIEYKYGLSSTEAKEVRYFITEMEKP